MQDLGFDTRHILINGQWRTSGSGETLALIDPSSGEVLTPIA